MSLAYVQTLRVPGTAEAVHGGRVSCKQVGGVTGHGVRAAGPQSPRRPPPPPLHVPLHGLGINSET